MKSKNYCLIVLVALLFCVQSCDDADDSPQRPQSRDIIVDVPVPADIEIQNFIWKGLNLYYLWQANVQNLSDFKFTYQSELNTFLYNYPIPEKLFDALRIDKNMDRFSWIVDDYIELEGQLQGNTNNNGVEFGLSRKSSGSNEIIGWVRYIIPNSNAATKNIKRGDIFYGVDGTQLTIDNYQSLLFGSNNDYTLNLADINGGAFTPNGKNIALTKTNLTENPILINKVITSGARKIGYLMYNGFYANFDTQLNDSFGSLKSKGITDLVLDLRYNSGGSVLSATRLASMITGSLTGKVFAKQQWNDKVESYYNANDANSLINFFTNKIGSTSINSLNLTRVYVLTTKSTASASELVINGLKPYVNVIQIGDVTTGKNVGSITLYDSPTYGKENRNPNHRYAMQPIVLKIVNSEGFGDYQNGLNPTYKQIEYLDNLGVLGESNEPFLSTAIAKITGVGRMKQPTPGIDFDFVSDSKSNNLLQSQMYLEKPPANLVNALK